MKKRYWLIPAALLLLLYMSSSYSPHPLPKGAVVDRLVEKKASTSLKRIATVSCAKPIPFHWGSSRWVTSNPNAADRLEAQRLGKPVGGDIKVHGLPNKLPYIGKWHRFQDWTAGCIAITNDEMEELDHAVPLGTVIEILP